MEILHEAERLWRGPSLADFLYEAFAQTPIAQLDELRAAIVEERIETELELGRRRALGELEALVAEHPLRERLRELMLALYRSGRQGTHAYQDARRSLLEELGIEPGPCPSEAPRRDPQAGAFPRRSCRPRPPGGHCRGGLETLLAGRLVPVLGSEVGELARRLAERFDFPADEEASSPGSPSSPRS